MKAAHDFIKPGVTEKQVAAYMEQELLKIGLEPPYHMLVASGPRAAVPHATSTDRVLQEGELVWVDFVCRCGGYVGDITRTFPVGQVTGRLAEMDRVCLEGRRRHEPRPGPA